MRKKGVSPVIATVLLVGMVIVLGMIIFLWMRSLAQETITKFEGQNIELSCDSVQIEASRMGNQLSISNIGNTPIYDFNIKSTMPGAYETQRASELFEGEWNWGLNPGGIFSGEASEIGDADKLTLIPILLGMSESGSQKTFTCNEKRHGQEVF